MSFCTNGTSADVTIDSDGDLGIGTTALQQKLHITQAQKTTSNTTPFYV